ARLPCPHGHRRWPQCAGPSSRQGPQAPDPVAPAAGAMSAPTPRRGFTRSQRLLKAAAFDAVYKLRVRVVDDCFAVNAAPNTLGHARLGLSIGAKAVGKIGRAHV